MSLEYRFKGLESITDMTLIVNGKESIAVNRLLLASVSAYFRNVFTSKVGEGISKTETPLDEISDVTVLKKLLKSFYTKNTLTVILENTDDGDYAVLFLELCDRLGINVPIENILHNIKYVVKNYKKLYNLLSEPDGNFTPENFIMFVALGTPESLPYVPELADELRYKVGQYIVFRTEKSIVLYNIGEDQEVSSVNDSSGSFNNIVIASPDGMKICSVAGNSELHIYSVEENVLKRIETINLNRKIFDICFSANGNYLASVSIKENNMPAVSLYETKEWKKEEAFFFASQSSDRYTIKMNHKDQILFIEEGVVSLYSLDGDLLDSKGMEHPSLSPDRKHLFSTENIEYVVNMEYKIHVYDTTDELTLITSYEVPDEVKAIGVGVKFFSYVILDKIYITDLVTSSTKIIDLPGYVDFIEWEKIKHSNDDKYIYMKYILEDKSSTSVLSIINIDTGEVKELDGVKNFDVFPIF